MIKYIRVKLIIKNFSSIIPFYIYRRIALGTITLKLFYILILIGVPLTLNILVTSNYILQIPYLIDALETNIWITYIDFT